MPFDDSRRLTGFNLYFADVGAVLETAGVDVDQALLEQWRARVVRMRAELDSLQRRLDIPMLLITHDPDDAATFGGHVLTMADGRVAGGG